MVIKILSFIWQLPQNLLGLLVILFSHANKSDNGVYRTKYRFGVSLGWYIIINDIDITMTVNHEKGHQKQSLYLGWLYLIIIGLPSFLFCLITNIMSCFIAHDKLYKFYFYLPWEKWADYLGGVKRFA